MRICIAHVHKQQYSETFIQAHIRRLPGTVKVVYGGWFPVYRGDGQPLLPPPGLVERLRRSVLRRILRVPCDYFEKQALQRYLLDEEIDIVIAEYGPVGTSVMDVCSEAGIPLVVYFRGGEICAAEYVARYGEAYRRLYRMAGAIIAVSREIETHALAQGAPRDKVHCIPSGTDTTLFSGGQPEAAPPLFLFVGRFVDMKAPYLAVLAFRQVLDEIPLARLCMVGDGDLLEACRVITKALGMSDAVEFAGVCPPEEVVARMRRARALVHHAIHTSRGEIEGTPNAVVEAGACGLPVVATAHSGIQDVVVHSVTGFLVPEYDVRGMADRMIQLARDPAMAGTMGRAARERICAHFSVETSIDRLCAVLQSVVRERRH